MKSGRTQSKTSGNPPSAASHDTPSTSNEDRYARVAAAAFYKAEARGFVQGHELEDWLAAEAEEK